MRELMLLALRIDPLPPPSLPPPLVPARVVSPLSHRGEVVNVPSWRHIGGRRPLRGCSETSDSYDSREPPVPWDPPPPSDDSGRVGACWRASAVVATPLVAKSQNPSRCSACTASPVSPVSPVSSAVNSARYIDASGSAVLSERRVIVLRGLPTALPTIRGVLRGLWLRRVRGVCGLRGLRGGRGMLCELHMVLLMWSHFVGSPCGGLYGRTCRAVVHVCARAYTSRRMCE